MIILLELENIYCGYEKLDIVKNMKTGEVSKTGLPTSNVLYYELENDAWCCVRPSGTEPKMKVYLAVKSNSLENTDIDIAKFKENVMEIINAKLN